MDGMIQQLAHHNSKNIIFSFALPQARAHTSNIQTSSSDMHAKKEAIVVACHFSPCITSTGFIYCTEKDSPDF
jgi:hypothetical protein